MSHLNTYLSNMILFQDGSVIAHKCLPGHHTTNTSEAKKIIKISRESDTQVIGRECLQSDIGI